MAILTFERISKHFPGVQALDEVSFAIETGECHALMGENGAGKSTLGKIVAGICQPDAGRMLLEGREVRFGSPPDATAAGISMVHQELAFCPNLSIAENLFLGRMPGRGGLLARKPMEEQARELLRPVGLNLHPSTPMERLSTAQEQLVQIALAIGRGARIIVMDEPTSSLSQHDAGRLFEIIEGLRNGGVTIVYVSHRMEEIARLCDRVSVLRDGKFIQTLPRSEATTDQIVRLMIGRPMEQYFPQHLERSAGAPLLEVRQLNGLAVHGVRSGEAPRQPFRDISFSVRAGEIVGLAGLVGAGRSEIARAIMGIDPIQSGDIRVEGRAATISKVRDAIDLSIGLVPEDRKRQGLVLSMTCQENLSLSMLQRLRRMLGFIDHRHEQSTTREYFQKLRVRAPGIQAPIMGLSGGNQQKIVLAKWLALHCKVLILDEPTRGVDVGAKTEIHALIDDLAAQGRGVLLISSELPELLALSTRILVIASGKIVGDLAREEANQESLMRLMAGVRAKDA